MNSKLKDIGIFLLTSVSLFLMLNYAFEGKFEISQFECGAIAGVVVWEIKDWIMEITNDD